MLVAGLNSQNSFPCVSKMWLISLVWVTAVILVLLQSDGYKVESLQEEGRTRQKIPQPAGDEAGACFIEQENNQPYSIQWYQPDVTFCHPTQKISKCWQLISLHLGKSLLIGWKVLFHNCFSLVRSNTLVEFAMKSCSKPAAPNHFGSVDNQKKVFITNNMRLKLFNTNNSIFASAIDMCNTWSGTSFCRDFSHKHLNVSLTKWLFVFAVNFNTFLIFGRELRLCLTVSYTWVVENLPNL